MPRKTRRKPPSFIAVSKSSSSARFTLASVSNENGYPFSLLTEASVNLADDDDLLTAMKDGGFRRVFLGIETPVEASLKEAQKSQNRGNLLDSVRKIQNHGMEVMA